MDTAEGLIRQVPFFETIDRVEIARLLGALESRTFAAGSVVFSEGEPADSLYLLEEGRVRLTVRTPGGEATLAELDSGTHFGELGVLLARRTASAHALTDLRVWTLPRERFEKLMREDPSLAMSVGSSLGTLLDRRSRERVGAPVPATDRLTIGGKRRPASRRRTLVGVAAMVGVPVALWWLPPPSGLSVAGWHAGLILLGAAIGWLLEPLPDFVVAFAMTAAWGIAGLVPLSVAFAGFLTPSWVLALGALVLAAAIVRSGLLYRLALTLLRTFPSTHTGQVLALVLGGVAVTPLLPLATARVATVASLSRELAREMGYAPRSHAGAAFGFAGLVGHGSFSSVFLTGLAMNFFVVELLPAADRVRFGWLGWLGAAIPAGIVILGGGLAALLWLFPPETRATKSPEVLRRQEQALGPLSRGERVTLVALAVLLLGLMLQPLHGIEPSWIAVSTIVLCFAGTGLDRDGFRTGVDWGYVVFFGLLLGTGGVLQRVGLDRWIASVLAPVAGAISAPVALVAAIALVVFAVRILVPRIPATLLLALVFVPAAPQLGLSPWVAGFVVLMAANTWLHPSQSDFLALIRGPKHDELFSEQDGIRMGVAITVVMLVALVVSVPYWQAIGVLAP